MKDLLNPKAKDLVSEQSDLSITPISMDSNIYLDVPKSQQQNDGNDANQQEAQDKYRTNSLSCLLGNRDGTIYIFDPILIQQGKISSFNNESQMPFHKAKRPEIVRWVEPSNLSSPITSKITENGQTSTNYQHTSVSKFVVVFEDGCIYLYEKDVTHDPKEDYTKSVIQQSSNQGREAQKDGKNMISKADVVVKMQSLVENFDFEQMYRVPDNQDGGRSKDDNANRDKNNRDRR